MEKVLMNKTTWLTPAIYGAVAGAVALAIVGFTWGGWMSTNAANQMASDQARLEVVAALVPICLEQSKHDPRRAETLADLKVANSYRRSGMIMDAGWATMPGSSNPNSSVASACLQKLAEQF
jgi:hypothetical protein